MRDNKISRKQVLIIACIILAVAAVIAIGPIRLRIAYDKAEKTAEESNIILIYEQKKTLETPEEFLWAIYKLAEWEEQTSAAIDRAFGLQDGENDEKYKENRVSGYESGEYLLEYAMNRRGSMMHEELKAETEKQIDFIFGDEERRFGIKKETVLSFYKKGGFARIVSAVDTLEREGGLAVYENFSSNYRDDAQSLPVDICYGLNPGEIVDGCNKFLESKIRDDNRYTVRNAAEEAKDFRNRYGVELSNLSLVLSRAESLEYAEAPDIPRVGMSLLEAGSTKLGRPTRTTAENENWNPKTHIYGTWYWDEQGRQIFRADFLDNKITNVRDTRKSLTASQKKYQNNSYSSKSDTNKDDSDRESDYEDDWDDYDYEDDYDDFLDEEDDWYEY